MRASTLAQRKLELMGIDAEPVITKPNFLSFAAFASAEKVCAKLRKHCGEPQGMTRNPSNADKIVIATWYLPEKGQIRVRALKSGCEILFIRTQVPVVKPATDAMIERVRALRSFKFKTARGHELRFAVPDSAGPWPFTVTPITRGRRTVACIAVPNGKRKPSLVNLVICGSDNPMHEVHIHNVPIRSAMEYVLNAN